MRNFKYLVYFLTVPLWGQSVDTLKVEKPFTDVLVNTEITNSKAAFDFELKEGEPFAKPYRMLYQEVDQDNLEHPLMVELSALNVKGVWQGEDQGKNALITVRNGLGVIAKVGDPIGPNGKIMDITKDGVKIIQYNLRPDGIQTSKETTLELK